MIAASEFTVQIESLVVDYGTTRALNQFAMAIRRGEIYGLLGPNGAGKTTLFQVLSTLLPPTSGMVRILGLPIAEDVAAVRRNISLMPDLAPIPRDLSAVEYLRVFAESYGLRGQERDRRVAECLEQVSLSDKAKERCHRLSLGMRQRLAFAKTILHRPAVLILDEPASGLDPIARVQLRESLQALAAEGTTVILSSHVLSDIEELCTSIGLIHKGALLDEGPTSEVLNRQAHGSSRSRITVSGEMSTLIQWAEEHPHLHAIKTDAKALALEVSFDESVLPAEQLFRDLASAELGVTSFQPLAVRLEDVIVSLSSPTSAL